MKISAKIKIRHDQVNSSNTAPIYLQVIINRKAKKIPLYLSWPVEKFDKKEGVCKSRRKDDPDVNDYNMMIRDALSRANEIFKYARLTGQPLTVDRFLFEYNNFLSKTDFLIYYKEKLAKRVRRKEIAETTRKNHQNTLNKLNEFYKELKFQEISKEKIEDFAIHLRHDLKLAHNSIWSHFKDVSTYLSLAKNDDKILFDEGYKDLKISAIEGDREPLSIEEFRAMHEYFLRLDTPYNHKRVLRPFLFSCLNGGIRISDQMAITHDHIKDNTLVLVPHKTRKTGKIVEIPIMNESKVYFESQSGRLFNCMAEQPANRILKKIAAILEIDKNVSHHVARETFATIYIEMGGNPAVLKEIMGHSKYSITLKYVHVNNKMKKEQMNLMRTVLEAKQLATA